LGDGISIQRRYTRAAPGALNVDALATDDDTAQAIQQINLENALLDIYSSPQPAAGVNYEVRLLKNNVQTGRTYFSTAMDPASAGRSRIGNVPISPGQIAYQVRQVLGALTAYSFVVQYDSSF